MESNCSLTLFAPAVATLPAVVDPSPVAPANNEIATLEETALALNSQINQGEKSLARTYWELGDALIQLRPLYDYGNWERELGRLGIEQTRARKAMWFREEFNTLTKAEKVESVSKVYSTRPRKQKQNKKARKVSVTMPEVGTGPEGVTEDEYAAFLAFVKACGDLDRAFAVVESCQLLFGEVAIHA
jgi:hypothetical protein